MTHRCPAWVMDQVARVRELHPDHIAQYALDHLVALIDAAGEIQTQSRVRGFEVGSEPSEEAWEAALGPCGK